MNEKKSKPEIAIEIGNALLTYLDEAKTPPEIAYAAVGCSFYQLHKALGHSKNDWIEWTKQMTEIDEKEDKS